jgi:predicted glycoside hydrolase/deacetylase ChbG (UPF0249 family)
MNLILSADDFGLSRGITDSILDVVRAGALNSVSIVPNGYAFAYAIEEYEKRTNLRLGIHLNLVEGFPVSDPADVGLLVDKHGKLHNSFIGLWLSYASGDAVHKQELRRQVAKELIAQIERVITSSKRAQPIKVDSHRHLHMVPFVTQVLVDILSKYPQSRLRLPLEPWLGLPEGALRIEPYLAPRVVKHSLLNILSKRLRAELRERHIACNAYFIGTLYTGRMNEKVVASGLARVSHRVGHDDQIEILFHPGRALESERSLWSDRTDLFRYYSSNARTKEKEVLEGPALRALLTPVTQ